MKKIYLLFIVIFYNNTIVTAQTPLQLLETSFEQQNDSLFNKFVMLWKYNNDKDTANLISHFNIMEQKDLLAIIRQSLFESIYLTTPCEATYIIIPNRIAIITKAESLPPSLRYSVKENIHILNVQDLNVVDIWRNASLNKKASIILGDSLLVSALGNFVKQSISDSIKQKKILFLQQKIPIYQFHSSNIYRNHTQDEDFYKNIYGDNGLFLPYNLPFISLIELNDKWNKAYINLNNTNLKPYTLSFTKKKSKWLRNF